MRLLSACYTGIISLLTPFILLRFYLKGIKQPVYRERLRERLGHYRKHHEPVDFWVHAVSFGEVEVATPLINLMLSNGYKVCVTTTTPSGSERVHSRLGDRIQHVYLPFELPYAISVFLNTFQPKVAVIMETEIWPNLFRQVQRRNIKCVIANGRLSPRSLKGYQKIRFMIRSLLNGLTLICAQTEDDRKRFCVLGANPLKTKVLGNIKFDMKEEPKQAEQGKAYRAALQSRPVFIAASTHPGEEDIVLKAFQQVRANLPDSLLILAPRHPDRTGDVIKLIERSGFSIDRRSECNTPETVKDVYLIDTLGELRMFYYVSDVAYVGGSLVEHGGHNVLEAIIANVPVVVGPHMFNFEDMYQMLTKSRGLLTVKDDKSLASALLSLYQDKPKRDALNRQAMTVLKDNQGSLDKHWTIIEELKSSF